VIGRLWVGYLKVSLEIFHVHNSSGCTMALGSTQPLTEMNRRDISGGGQPVHRGDNLTTFMRRLSLYLAASTCWNPQGLPRPTQELLYLQWAGIVTFYGLDSLGSDSQ
jgi:hypothetical protein